MVHKALLTNQSEYFHKALNGKFKEAGEQAIRLPEESPDAFDLLIGWLYQNQIPVAGSAPGPFQVFARGLTGGVAHLNNFISPNKGTFDIPYHQRQELIQYPPLTLLQSPWSERFDNICCQFYYEHYSPEELRLVDYERNRRFKESRGCGTSSDQFPVSTCHIKGVPFCHSLKSIMAAEEDHQMSLIRLCLFAETICWTSLFNHAISAYIQGEISLCHRPMPKDHIELIYQRTHEKSPCRKFAADSIISQLSSNGQIDRDMDLVDQWPSFLEDIFQRLRPGNNVAKSHDPKTMGPCEYHTHPTKQDDGQCSEGRLCQQYILDGKVSRPYQYVIGMHVQERSSREGVGASQTGLPGYIRFPSPGGVTSTNFTPNFGHTVRTHGSNGPAASDTPAPSAFNRPIEAMDWRNGVFPLPASTTVSPSANSVFGIAVSTVPAPAGFSSSSSTNAATTAAPSSARPSGSLFDGFGQTPTSIFGTTPTTSAPTATPSWARPLFDGLGPTPTNPPSTAALSPLAPASAQPGVSLFGAAALPPTDPVSTAATPARRRIRVCLPGATAPAPADLSSAATLSPLAPASVQPTMSLFGAAYTAPTNPSTTAAPSSSSQHGLFGSINDSITAASTSATGSPSVTTSLPPGFVSPNPLVRNASVSTTISSQTTPNLPPGDYRLSETFDQNYRPKSAPNASSSVTAASAEPPSGSFETVIPSTASRKTSIELPESSNHGASPDPSRPKLVFGEVSQPHSPLATRVAAASAPGEIFGSSSPSSSATPNTSGHFSSTELLTGTASARPASPLPKSQSGNTPRTSSSSFTSGSAAPTNTSTGTPSHNIFAAGSTRASEPPASGSLFSFGGSSSPKPSTSSTSGSAAPGKTSTGTPSHSIFAAGPTRASEPPAFRPLFDFSGGSSPRPLTPSIFGGPPGPLSQADAVAAPQQPAPFYGLFSNTRLAPSVSTSIFPTLSPTTTSHTVVSTSTTENSTPALSSFMDPLVIRSMFPPDYRSQK